MTENNFYYSNDVCIVGIGCVLPEADNPQAFWKNISTGHCSIRKMPEDRFDSELYLDESGQSEDKAYSNKAGFVADDNFEKNDYKTRMSALSIAAANQALDCLTKESRVQCEKKGAVYLGCMGIDETLTWEKIFRRNEKSFKEYVMASQLDSKEKILKTIRERFYVPTPTRDDLIASIFANHTIASIKDKFGIVGPGCLVDAACASSLAALDIAVEVLKNYEADVVLSGGIEANLGPDTFVLFGQVGALSKGVCHPFDTRADGLSQGEGAVVFALQRVEDALRDKNKIYGVIKSIGASSDGRSSSLFSPSAAGQILAMERAWQNLDNTCIDYIECHGTGTKVGDRTEVESLNSFFAPSRIPIGSVKALIGHTKGTAGAAGVLKCLLSMENRIIPSSGYVKNSIIPTDSGVYVNKENILVSGGKKGALRMGISSFGFGNINYHIVLDEFKKECPVIERKKESIGKNEVVIIGQEVVFLDKIDLATIAKEFKIPPRGIPQADKAQLGALLAVRKVLAAVNIEIRHINKENVSVISASLTCLDAAIDFMERVRHFELKKVLDFLDDEPIDFMIKHKDKFPKVTEDTGPGILNNVISGKICNTFDFKGKNFNVDADLNSFPAALKIASRELRKNKKTIVVLVYFDEKLGEENMRVKKNKVSCLLLSTLDYALKKNYPIREVIKEINYHD